MPKAKYKALTLSESIFNMAKKKAEKQRRSIANYVSNLIEDDKN